MLAPEKEEEPQGHESESMIKEHRGPDTFILTGHPLYGPLVIIMLTDRKCKDTDLEKIKRVDECTLPSTWKSVKKWTLSPKYSKIDFLKQI